MLTGGGGGAPDLLKAGFTLSERMLSHPAPVVLACTGHAIAMGLFLTLSADYRIGVSGPYRLTANEVAIGMTLPRTATEICRYRLSPACFDRAIVLAEVFTPESAVPAGILDRVVDPGELDAAVAETVARLTTLNMAAHHATKLRARAGLLETLRAAIDADDADFRGAALLAARGKAERADARAARPRPRGGGRHARSRRRRRLHGARRVAASASTSTAAVYELFGDKAGLVREVFFGGFERLASRLGRIAESDDPRADLVTVTAELRSFVRDHPVLAEVMFSRPFADFDPGPEEAEAGRSVREFIVGRVRRCVDAGILAGPATDIAHVFLALVHGLARQEQAGWLGSSKASVNRRWALAVDAVLTGLTPSGSRAPAGRQRRPTRAGGRRIPTESP